MLYEYLYSFNSGCQLDNITRIPEIIVILEILISYKVGIVLDTIEAVSKVILTDSFSDLFIHFNYIAGWHRRNNNRNQNFTNGTSANNRLPTSYVH